MQNKSMYSLFPKWNDTKKMKLVVNFLFVLSIIFALIHPQPVLAETTQTSPRFEPITALGGSVSHVTGAGNILFSISGARLEITDISRPQQPVLLGEWSDINRPDLGPIFLLGNYLYVVQDNYRLTILDVQNPSNPIPVISKPCNESNYAISHLAAVGNTLYLIQGPNLQVYDISTADSPQFIKTVQPYAGGDFIDDLLLSGGYLYLLSDKSGIKILSLTNPANPSSIGSLAMNEGQKLAKSKNVLYISRGTSLSAVNVAVPAAPKEVGTYSGGTYFYVTYGIGAAGNSLLIYNWSTGTIDVLDISNPSSITLKGSLPLKFTVDALYAAGSTAYSATDRAGLAIIDFLNPAAPVLMKTFGQMSHPTSLDSKGDLTLVASGKQLWQVDSVGTRAVYTSLHEIVSITLNNQIAYLGGEDPDSGKTWFEVVDFSNPSSPVKLAEIPTNISYVVSVQLIGHYAVFAGLYDLVSIDIQNPAKPVIAATEQVDLSANIRSITATKATLLVLVSSGLRTYSFGADGKFTLLGSNPQIRGSGIAAAGQYAYAEEEGKSNAVAVIDLSNPASPTVIGSARTCGMVEAAAISTHFLYIVNGCSAMERFDIAAPNAPIRMNSADLPSGTWMPVFAFNGDRVRLALGSGGYFEFRQVAYVVTGDVIPVSGGSLSLSSKGLTVAIPQDGYAQPTNLMLADIQSPGPSAYTNLRGFFQVMTYVFTTPRPLAEGKTMTFTFNLSSVAVNTIDQHLSPILLRWDRDHWSSDGLQSTYNSTTNQLVVKVSPFSGNELYGVFDVPQPKIYLPMLRK